MQGARVWGGIELKTPNALCAPFAVGLVYLFLLVLDHGLVMKLFYYFGAFAMGWSWQGRLSVCLHGISIGVSPFSWFYHVYLVSLAYCLKCSTLCSSERHWPCFSIDFSVRFWRPGVGALRTASIKCYAKASYRVLQIKIIHIKRLSRLLKGKSKKKSIN
jgi:hypothetical protein